MNRSRRRSVWAWGISALVHALILAAIFWEVRSPPRESTPAVAAVALAPVRVALVSTSEAAPAGTPTPAATASLPNRPSTRAPAKGGVTQVSAELHDAPVPSDSARGDRVAAGSGVADAGAAGGPGGNATSPSTAQGTGGLPGPAAAGGGTVDLTALHARIAEAAARCYPPEARSFRLTGTVSIAFCAEPDGSVSQVRRTRSSGEDLLDAAAEECVLPGASPLPVHSGCYEVPIQFGMP